MIGTIRPSWNNLSCPPTCFAEFPRFTHTLGRLAGFLGNTVERRCTATDLTEPALAPALPSRYTNNGWFGHQPFLASRRHIDCNAS